MDVVTSLDLNKTINHERGLKGTVVEMFTWSMKKNEKVDIRTE